jgi:hypothetical protein
VNLVYAIVVSVPAEKHNIHIWHTSPLILQVVSAHLTLHGQRCICHKDVFTSCGSDHNTFSGLYSTRPTYAVVTRRTTNVSPYRTIGTASSKPHLEATGPEFTSPDTRILTFLPWGKGRHCYIILVRFWYQLRHPTPKQGWSVLTRIHMSWQHRNIDA